jgi:dipeptidyl aminopeptidase/acylaminoacyl peptidase
MKNLLLAAVLAAVSFPAMSAAKSKAAEPRAITVHDLVNMERIADPRVAPNGTVAAYVLRETDYANNKGVKNIWLVEIPAKNPPRKLTSGSGNNHSPRWSADGKWLYFLSTRGGSSQVWRLYGQGGEAQQVTEFPLDVGAFRLSPDGTRLAVSMEVFLDCADIACSKKKLDELAARKNTGQLYDRLFVRHWDTWKNGTRAQLFVSAIGEDGKAGEPAWVSKGLDGDVPSKPFGGDEEWAFAPDGKSIVFAARVVPGSREAWSTNLDLWRAPVDGSGKPQNLTKNNEAVDNTPVFSPDGSKLYYLSMSRPGFEADRYRIVEMDFASAGTREIAPEWDRSPGSLTLSADGKTLFVTADDLGQKPLFAIRVDNGNVTRLTAKGSVSAFSTGRNGIVYAMNTLTSPDQLYSIDFSGNNPTQLTQHNSRQLSEIRFGEPTQFTFKGWNDEEVYGYVMTPWNYKKGRKYPVAFIVHGGPQGSMGNDWHYRWNPAVISGMGYAVVFIDFHGSTGYGQAFTDSISGDWGGKPLEDLQKGWAHALKAFPYLDGDKACALGASYGGYMMNWIAGNWPDAFKCIVNHDGIFDNRSMAYVTEELWFDEWEMGGAHFDVPENYEKHNPVNHVKNWKTPMLVIHGEKDYRVPPEQGIATFTALQRRGIPSQLLIFPDENHWVLKPQNSVQWHDTVQAWMKRWVGPQ